MNQIGVLKLAMTPRTSGNQKYYISYINRERQCGNCFDVKPFDAFTLEKNGRPKTNCNECRSKIISRKVLENKLVMFPNLYKECDKCDHIYNKCHTECLRCSKEKYAKNRELCFT